MTFIRSSLGGQLPIRLQKPAANTEAEQNVADKADVKTPDVADNKPTLGKPVPVDTLLANNGIVINNPEGPSLSTNAVWKGVVNGDFRDDFSGGESKAGDVMIDQNGNIWRKQDNGRYVPAEKIMQSDFEKDRGSYRA